MHASVSERQDSVKIELLVAPDCVPCAKAEALWRDVAHQQGLTLTVLDRREQEGKFLSHRFHLKTFPALVINGKLVAVGVQSREQAESLLCATVAGLESGNNGAGVRSLSWRQPPQDVES